MSMNDTLNPHPTETEKWLLTEFYCQALNEEMDKSPDTKSFLETYWPFLNSYYSPLNALYTPVYKDFCAKGFTPLHENEKQKPAWMLRDGAVPLTWFFSQHSPESVQGDLLVDADLSFVVPEEWRQKVGFFRHRTLENEKLQTLLMATPVSERLVSLPELENLLAKIQSVIGKRKMATLPIQLYAPIRRDSEVFPGRFFQTIFSHFKNVTMVEWKDVVRQSSFRGTAYVELNAGWLFKDSYFQHHVLSRGAHLLFGKRNTRARYFPLSPFHGVELEKISSRAGKAIAMDTRLEKFYTQTRSRNVEHTSDRRWPTWHELQCRSTFASKILKA
jgi:hypothetical protein